MSGVDTAISGSLAGESFSETGAAGICSAASLATSVSGSAASRSAASGSAASCPAVSDPAASCSAASGAADSPSLAGCGGGPGRSAEQTTGRTHETERLTPVARTSVRRPKVPGGGRKKRSRAPVATLTSRREIPHPEPQTSC